MITDLKKIVLIGPESTGKSTLAESLALYFQTEFVPEFARKYLEDLDRSYIFSDLLEIAKGQIRLEERMIQKAANNLLFCDTDLYVIKVWSEHKYGKCHPWILEQIACRNYDLYFLTDIDIPWSPDPQREHPEPNMRSYFFNIYQDIVLHSGKPWKLLSGTERDRLNQGIDFIKALN